MTDILTQGEIDDLLCAIDFKEVDESQFNYIEPRVKLYDIDSPPIVTSMELDQLKKSHEHLQGTIADMTDMPNHHIGYISAEQINKDSINFKEYTFAQCYINQFTFYIAIKKTTELYLLDRALGGAHGVDYSHAITKTDRDMMPNLHEVVCDKLQYILLNNDIILNNVCIPDIATNHDLVRIGDSDWAIYYPKETIRYILTEPETYNKIDLDIKIPVTIQQESNIHLTLEEVSKLKVGDTITGTMSRSLVVADSRGYKLGD